MQDVQVRMQEEKVRKKDVFFALIPFHTNYRSLEQICTGPPSSSERSSTVYVILFIYESTEIKIYFTDAQF
jgi:hypothetical protein